MSAIPSQPPRASWGEWIQTVLLAANLVWTTLCLGGYRAETMVVTSAVTALVVVVHLGRRALASAPRRLHPAGWLLLPFLGYAMANVLGVTPVRWLGWHDWLGWAQLIAVFWVVVNDVRTRATRGVLCGVILALATVAVGLACYQRFARPDWLMLGATQTAQFLSRSSGPFAIPNSFAAMLVLVLPATALPLWRRGASAVERVGFGYLALLLLLGLGLTFSRGAWLGLALAAAAWPWLASGVRWRKRLGLFAGVSAVLATALITVYAAVPHARVRLDELMRDNGERSRPVMWRAAWAIFRAAPLLGGGAGSYAVRFEPHRPEHEQKDPQWTHNDYLNTLSDYGAVGGGLFFGACGVIAWRSARRRRAADGREGPKAVLTGAGAGGEAPAFTTALAVGVLAFALHLGVDYHLKIPALAMLVAMVAGMSVARAWPAMEPGERAVGAGRRSVDRAVAMTAAVGIAGAALGWVVPHYRAEAERETARLRLDGLAGARRTPEERRAVAGQAREALGRALARDPVNAQAWADRAYAAAIIGYDEPARQQELGLAAEGDARRALALSLAVPEFWLRLGVALDLQGRWLEAGEAFAEALRLAPVNATTWFYYAYHLSLNRVTLSLARAAVATSLRLDPSRPEAEALRDHLAARR